MNRVLVTGGAGFIGSHLAEALFARGAQVTVLDNVATGAWQNLATLQGQPRFTAVVGDVTDTELVRHLVGQAEWVFHLAADVGVARVAENPLHTVTTNIGPTQTVLQAALDVQRAGRPMRVFLASSSEVYGKNPQVPWSEDDDLVWGPTTCLRWAYGASKAIDEFLALAHHRQFGLPVVIARFFNVVGPRQVGTYGMVLPRFARAALLGQPLLVHDDGRQQRCFAHVADVVRAVLGLMDSPAATGLVVNLGSDQPLSIKDLATRVCELAGVPVQLAFQPYHEAYGHQFEDVRLRVPNLTRLRSLLDFVPQYDLDATILSVLAAQRQVLRGTSGT